jgi:hypothetical protein
MEVRESSRDHAHADANAERRGNEAYEEVIGNDRKAICLNAPRTSHGVAQVEIHSQVAYLGTGVVDRQQDIAMYGLSTYTSTGHRSKVHFVRSTSMTRHDNRAHQSFMLQHVG